MGSLVATSSGMTWVIVPILLLGLVAGFVYWLSTQGGSLLTDRLSVPLDGAATAIVDVDSDSGNLTIDRLSGTDQLLASGTLQYFEKQGRPTQILSSAGTQASIKLTGGGNGMSSIRLPWSACVGAYEWQIHLNPVVSSDVAVHSGGGNVKLDLAGLSVSRLSADTGGGNVDVVLPDNAANLSALAKTGAGNVTVEIGDGTTGATKVDASSGAGNVVVNIPRGLAARIQATSGLGTAIVDPRFSQTDKNTYQSSDYDGAADRVEIVMRSGAGNVSVNTR